MKVVVGVVLAIAVGVGIYYVRAATIGRDTPEGAGSSLEVIVQASTVREPTTSKEEMARALVNVCRLQVDTTVVQDRFRQLSNDVFRFVLSPKLIPRDQVQLRGCLEDTRVQHLILHVLTMQEFDPETAPVTVEGAR